MNIEGELLRKLDSSIGKIDENVFRDFQKEVDFINKVIQLLDDINENTHGQSIRIQVKEMHQSPYVVFDRPSYIRDTDPELADLLFLLHYFQDGQIIESRASFSQSKFVSGRFDDYSSRRWKIQRHQHYFLNYFPEFEFKWTGANRKFDIDPVSDTFSTYTFVSDFLWPFFQQTSTTKHYMYNKMKDPTKFTLPREYPRGVRRFHAVLKRLIRGRYGEPFNQNSDIYDMIDYMFEKARNQTFTKSNSPNTLPDGGRQSKLPLDNPSGDPDAENERGLIIVEIDIVLDSEEMYIDDMENMEQILRF